MKMPRFVRWVVRIVLLVVVLLFVLAAVLPALLASRRAQSWLAQRMNAGLTEEQQVSWARVSLGWFGEQRFEDIVYRDAGVQLTIDAVSVERGLVSFLGRNVQPGKVLVDRPRIEITLPPPVVTAPPTDDEEVRVPEPPDVPAMEEDREPAVAEIRPFRMPIEIKGTFLVRNGRLQVASATGSASMVWEDIDIEVDFADGLRQPVGAKLRAQQADATATGHVALAASAQIFQPDGTFEPDQFAADLSVELQGIHTASLAWIANEQVGAPMFHSVLDTQLTVVIAGSEDLTFSLDTHIANPEVSGGPLGQDRLVPGDTTIKGRGTWKDGTLRLADVSLSNALVQFHGGGSLATGHATTYPVGQMGMDLTADVARVALQLPETLQLQEGLVIDEGTVTANVAWDSDGDTMSINAAAELPKVRAQHHEQVLTVDEPIKASLSLKNSPAGPVLETLTVQTGFADIKGQGDLEDFSFRMDVDLDAAWQTAANFIDLGPQSFGGRITADARLQAHAEETRHFQITVASPGLTFGLVEDQVFAFDSFSLASQGNVHFEGDAGVPVRMSDLRAILQSDPVKGSATVADVDLAAAPPAFATATVQWDIDFDRVFAILAPAGVLPDDMRLSGRMRGAAEAAMEDGTLQVSPFDASITNLHVIVPGLDFEESSMSMQWALTLALPPAAPTLTLTNGHLQATSFSLTIPDLRVAVPAGASPLLTVQAALLADLGALMPLLQAASGAPIEMEGDSATAFSWQGPLDPVWENMVRLGQGTADIRVPHITAYGMQATNVVVAMQAQDGRIHLALDTAANEGRVVIHPVIDVTGEVPSLMVPENSHVIRDVMLNDEMASALLALLHPILRGSSVLGGSVNLTLEICRVPLSETGLQGADLRGLLILRDLELEPRGTLLRIMETAKLRSQNVHVAEQEIAFRLEDGRMYPSPLELAVAGHALSFTGSVGLDSSLDYQARVPVTAALVGREAFRFLEGSTIVLAIGGTAVRPEIGADAFAQAVAAMVRDAARNALRKEGREAARELQERGEDALRDLLRQHR